MWYMHHFSLAEKPYLRGKYQIAMQTIRGQCKVVRCHVHHDTFMCNTGLFSLQFTCLCSRPSQRRHVYCHCQTVQRTAGSNPAVHDNHRTHAWSQTSWPVVWNKTTDTSNPTSTFSRATCSRGPCPCVQVCTGYVHTVITVTQSTHACKQHSTTYLSASVRPGPKVRLRTAS